MPASPPEKPDGIAVFSSMAWEDAEDSLGFNWEDANLRSCLVYLRGNKYLQLPREWQQCFPRHLAVPQAGSRG